MRLSRKRRIYVLSKSIQYHISVDILFYYYYYFRYFSVMDLLCPLQVICPLPRNSNSRE